MVDLSPHMEPKFGDGITRSCQGMAKHGPKKLRGKIMAGDWLRDGRILPINRPRVSKVLGINLFVF